MLDVGMSVVVRFSGDPYPKRGVILFVYPASVGETARVRLENGRVLWVWKNQLEILEDV